MALVVGPILHFGGLAFDLVLGPLPSVRPKPFSQAIMDAPVINVSLNKRGVNCLLKDFRKCWKRMKINEVPQKKQTKNSINKTVFTSFPEKQSVISSNQSIVLTSKAHKTHNKHLKRQKGIERFTHYVLYWFIQTTSSSHNTSG